MSNQPTPAPQATGGDSARSAVPPWFDDFLADRETRKPSRHTIKAYRQDFAAISRLLAEGHPGDLAPDQITKDAMRRAFAEFAREHDAASIRRCWSTWNTLCTYLYSADLLAANPMALVGRPKLAKTLPKALPRPAVEALLAAVERDENSYAGTLWAERDLALLLTGLLAGLRAEELRSIDIGDLRTLDHGGALIYVRGKGGKVRSVPIEAEMLAVIEAYLASRAIRFPPPRRKTSSDNIIGCWPGNTPLFVGRDGQRITRGTVQSRIRRAFRQAGPDAQPVPGALIHGLRHTYATELANAEVSVYTLMKLLGHESMATSQRYVTAAGAETRDAAARNPLYGFVANSPSTTQPDVPGNR